MTYSACGTLETKKQLQVPHKHLQSSHEGQQTERLSKQRESDTIAYVAQQVAQRYKNDCHLPAS
eukprot:424387-Amphidinium_carterae.1